MDALRVEVVAHPIRGILAATCEGPILVAQTLVAPARLRVT
jgi:hypothetical protein